jgi:hypothetical protein
MPSRYDNITITAERSKDGWIIDRPVITRSGIFVYKDASGKSIREYRPDEEVFKADSLTSIRGMPITDGHRGILNTNSNLDGIVVGSVMGPGVKQDSDVVADIVIHNVNKIGKKRELSLGYECRIDAVPGEWNGQKYDQVQRDIVYNHLAVVNKGRAGNARIRLDADELVSFEVEDDMPDVPLSKFRSDGIEYPAAPEVINYITKQKEEIALLTTRADKAEAERDTAKNELANLAKTHKESLDKERMVARDRIKLEDKANQLSIKFDADDSDRSIKEKIINKLGNELRFDGKSDDYVNSAFDLTLAHEEQKNKTAKGQREKTTTKQDETKSSGGSSADARERMLRRIRGEKEAA